MRRLSWVHFASAFLSLAAVLALPAFVQAADKPESKSEKIVFETFDGVELQGDFYPSAKGTKAPTALLLHKLGGNRKQLAPLAEKLQAEDFAVLTFDFRGHGDSTSVQPAFWMNGTNARSIPRPKVKDTLDFKQMPRGYYPMMINDIAAAKYALEKKNNARECNAGDLVIIGCDDGATLGAVWAATEWNRRRLVQSMGVLKPGEPEGKDIAACVWLSLRGSLGSGANATAVAVDSCFGPAEKDRKMRDKVAHCFFYGDGDNASKTLSENIYNNVLRAGGAGFKQPTFKKSLKGTKLTGHELLGKEDIEIEEAIAKKYLKDVVFEKRAGTVWSERDLKMSPLIEVPASEYAKYGVRAP